MKEKILKIIHASPQSEPIYQLQAEYKRLTDDDHKKEFLSIIKSIALNGSDKEKFASLTTIEFLNQAKENEDLIKSIVETIVFKENEKLIPPLLTLCAMLSFNWAIAFIKKVIEHFKPKSNEYSYFFDIGIRSMASTPYWKEVIEEIKWAIKNYDDDYIIDFFAYCKWKLGDHELEKLFQLVCENNFAIKKILNLEAKINDRYINNYGKINQRN
jgi:hypothetical protein